MTITSVNSFICQMRCLEPFEGPVLPRLIREEVNEETKNRLINLVCALFKRKVDQVLLEPVGASHEDDFQLIFTAYRLYNLLLPKRSLNIERVNRCGVSLLMKASSEGFLGSVDALIKMRANIDLQGDRGITAAHLAAMYNRDEVLKRLTDSKINLNLKDEYGHTPLHIAALLGNLASIRILAATKVDLDSVTKSGQTALQTAVLSSGLESVKLLVKAGADLKIRDNLGFTALDLANECRDFKVFNYLDRSC